MKILVFLALQNNIDSIIHSVTEAHLKKIAETMEGQNAYSNLYCFLNVLISINLLYLL